MRVLLEVDPNLVRPGWTPLLIVLLLAIALFFLGRSMIKQFGKIDVPADHDPAASTAGPGRGAHRGAAERTPTRPGQNPPMPDLRAPHVDDSGDPPPPERS